MLLFGVLLVLILAADCHHECDTALAKIKSQLSRKIDQGLYKYYDLQAQAKTNSRQLEKIVNKVPENLLSDCFVDDKLDTLHAIILEYQRLYSGVTTSYDFQKIDDHFDETKSELEQNNARCIQIIKRFCS